MNYTIGGLCSAMVGPGMAVAIARALNAPPLVLFSLIPVGFATNYMGDAGGPLAVLFVAIVAAKIGKAVSKETKIDILVTPIVTVPVSYTHLDVYKRQTPRRWLVCAPSLWQTIQSSKTGSTGWSGTFMKKRLQKPAGKPKSTASRTKHTRVSLT